VEIRGNVGTRLRKLSEQTEFAAIILAAAGLERLHFRMDDAGQLSGDDVPPGLIARPIPIEEMLPCVGQAALGIEIRENDPRLERICVALNNAETNACVTAERTFLQGMGGGCQLAVGAYGQIAHGALRLCAISFLGPKPVHGETSGSIQQAAELGKELAQQLR
jgi:hydroxymethylbilane synthase